jgi:hypothetical protein
MSWPSTTTESIEVKDSEGLFGNEKPFSEGESGAFHSLETNHSQI